MLFEKNGQLEHIPMQEGKKKDPNAPKKPLTAYMVWLQENRAAIKDKYPGISLTDIAKKAGEMWKEVADKSVRAWAIQCEGLGTRLGGGGRI